MSERIRRDIARGRDPIHATLFLFVPAEVRLYDEAMRLTREMIRSMHSGGPGLSLPEHENP